MSFRILFIGDVVGKAGCRALAQLLGPIRRERHIGCIIANVENVAGGSGITWNLYRKIQHYGVDVMTLGDHAFSCPDAVQMVSQERDIIRPANLSPRAAGRGSTVWTSEDGIRVGVATMIGRLYMKPAENPYLAAEDALAGFGADVKLRLVEMHAEATAEKVAMGWHLAGRATAVVGSHTHVPSADERVLPGGTAYITDLGMTGAYESVLGRQVEDVLHFQLTSMPHRFGLAEGDVRLGGVIVEADPDTGKALSIERVSIPVPSEPKEDAATEDTPPRVEG